MKFLKINLLAIAMLFSVAAVNADATTGGRSVFMPVSMTGTASSNVGWSGSIYQHDSDELRACFKVQLEYGANNKRSEIGKYLIPGGNDTLIIGPANTTGALNDTEVSGLNLILGNDFKAELQFAPKAQDLVIDFGMYVDLAEWLDGLYFRSHMPLQNARWEIELTETNKAAFGATNLVAGDIYDETNAVVIANKPYADAIAAFKGDKTVADTVKWSYGKIDGKQTETRLGDSTVTLGYNFINKEHCHLGLGVTGVLGGGGKTKAEYMFEPIIGYAGRFGVGGTLEGGARLWDKDDEHQLVANMTFHAAHLFDNEQVRSYDVTDCGDFSRYLLVKKFSSATAFTSGPGTLDNMINVGTVKAKIGVDVVYNGNITFCWQMGNVSLDFGYQVAGHGKEKHKEFVDTIAADTYGLYDFTTNNMSNATFASKIQIDGNTTGMTNVTAGAGNANWITNDRLVTDSALMKAAVEHTLFAGLNYNWSDNEWNPGVGMLGSYHIAGGDNNTFDRWSVGFQFNFSV